MIAVIRCFCLFRGERAKRALFTIYCLRQCFSRACVLVRSSNENSAGRASRAFIRLTNKTRRNIRFVEFFSLSSMV